MLYSDWLKCVNPPMLLFIIHDGTNEVTITPSMGVIGIKNFFMGNVNPQASPLWLLSGFFVFFFT